MFCGAMKDCRNLLGGWSVDHPPWYPAIDRISGAGRSLGDYTRLPDDGGEFRSNRVRTHGHTMPPELT